MAGTGDEYPIHARQGEKKVPHFLHVLGLSTLNRYMDTQNAPKINGKRRATKTFCKTLREDPNFRLDAKRIGLTAFAVLFLDIAMVWLLRTSLVNDTNTHKLIVCISFATTMTAIWAVLCFVLRILEEFSSYLLERMNE